MDISEHVEDFIDFSEIFLGPAQNRKKDKGDQGQTEK